MGQTEQSGALPPAVATQAPAWLVSRPDEPGRVCWPIANHTTRVGRAPDNDVVIPEPKSVSLYHLVIERVNVGGLTEFRLRDLASTNGTYVDGTRVTECILLPEATIRLGSQGPEFSLVLEEPLLLEFDRTIMIPARSLPEKTARRQQNDTYDAMVSESIARVRLARAQGLAGQTMTIMRATLDHALRRASRRWKIFIGILAIGVVGVSGYAAWKITRLTKEKHAIDRRIMELETQVQNAASTDEATRLMKQLDNYQAAGRQLQGDPLYRFGRHAEDPITTEIRGLMAEFGAEEYSVPPEFTERVKYYIQQYLGPERPLVTQALYTAASQVYTLRQVMQEQHLPADLSYMPVVESALNPPSHSRAGGVGLWQLRPLTARAYGLRVDRETDERLDSLKATRAASRYLRDLILEFGAGSSVMLALAAYDLGPTKVKQAIDKVVSDPIRQRDFWYLYRVKAIPAEAREYVPKVIAVMIIAHDPGRFGFSSQVGG
jgi:hypothetical protein